jgi:hypothetical protein
MLPPRRPLKPPLPQGVVPSMAAVATTPEPCIVTQAKIERDFAEVETLVRPEKPRHSSNGNGHSNGATTAATKHGCTVSKTVSGTCDKCHRKSFPLHWPRDDYGFFCAACCSCNHGPKNGSKTS